MVVVAGRPLREVEDGQHQLQGVRRRARAAAYHHVVHGEDRLGRRPSPRRTVWTSVTSIGTRGAAKSWVRAGSRNALMPTPTSADGAIGGRGPCRRSRRRRARRSAAGPASSSNPLIQSAAIERGERLMRAGDLRPDLAGGQPALEPLLLLPHDLALAEPLLAVGRPDRAGPAAGLDPGDPQRRVVVARAPDRVVDGDVEGQARRRPRGSWRRVPRARRPGGQVVREPGRRGRVSGR